MDVAYTHVKEYAVQALANPPAVDVLQLSAYIRVPGNEGQPIESQTFTGQHGA